MNKHICKKIVQFILIFVFLFMMADKSIHVQASSYQTDTDLSTAEEEKSVSGEESSATSTEVSTTENAAEMLTSEDSFSLYYSTITDVPGNSQILTYEENTRLSGGTYIINSVDSWIALQKYSQQQDLTGCEFYYLKNGESSIYALTESAGFTGLGSADYPFKGTLHSSYDSGNISLQTAKPLFNYLSSAANIYNINIQVTGTKCSAGLAQHLVADAGDLSMSLNGITITGDTINFSDSNCEYEGGIFAQISNIQDSPLVIEFLNVTVTVSVKAAEGCKAAGGWIGHVTGKTTLLLSNSSNSYTVENTVDALKKDNILGGLIGCVENAELTLQAADSYSIQCKANVGSGSKNLTAGSVFGTIENSNVIIDCVLSVVGGVLKGKVMGGFSGEIKDSHITLNHTFSREASTMFLDKTSGSDDENVWTMAGMFAGKMENSTIEPGTTLDENANAVSLKGSGNGSNLCVSGSASSTQNYRYHIGGFAGYMTNSDLLFTDTHRGEIIDFTTGQTAGNVSVGIGYYKADNDDHKIQNLNVTGTSSIRLICYKGYASGLVSKMVVENSSTVIMQGCKVDVKGGVCIVLDDDSGSLALGVAYLENTDGTESTLSIEDLSLKMTSSFTSIGTKIAKSYGNVIGIADADFNITDTTFSNNTNPLPVGNGIKNYGGLVGEIQNSCANKTGVNKVRKVSVLSVTIGKTPFSNFENTFGGLFGSVGERTAVSMSGNIDLNNSTAGIQTATPAGYMGSIAGKIDNALLYFEPDTTFSKSTSYTCNEIGNYGGVIRNRTGEMGTQKLIENYQVTGTLEESIDSVEDLMRLAIVLNTQGEFMPSGNPSDTIDTIRDNNYTLTLNSYNLKETGLMCLGRNDRSDKMTQYPFVGSLTGVERGTTITYEMTGYGRGQSNLGLFPAVGDGARFENLKLDYEICYTNTSYSGNNVPSGYENTGGLAVVAKGDVAIENVSYKGTMKTLYNANLKVDSSNVFSVRYDYLGGLIGQYKGQDSKTLTIKNINAEMEDFSIGDPTHVMGGIIGYVDMSGVTDGQVHINVEGTNCVTGNIKYENSTYKLELVGMPIMMSPFITLIGDLNKNGEEYTYAGNCAVAVNHLTLENLTQSINGRNSPVAMGGLLGYKWVDVDAAFSDINIGGESAPVQLSGKANFGGLIDTVYGKIDANDVKWANTAINATMSINSSAVVENCGMFVRNGQYLYLSVKDYVVSSDVTLKNYAGNYFDELVGFNIGGSDADHGGIVSISESAGAFLGRGDANYKRYNAIVGTKKNPNTRYYYDLDQLTDSTSASESESVSENGYSTLDSPKDVMIWHLMHYVNPNIRKTLSENVPDTLPTAYTISGMIDMSGYSLYPTTVAGEIYTANGAKIVLDAQKIITGEATQSLPMYPEDADYQHYQMQAGLFGNVAGVSVEGLTLSGTYSQYSSDATTYAGALVAGQIHGIENGTDSNNKTLYDTTVKNSFENITLNNLWCVANGDVNYANPIGLMIADIASGADVTLDGISMTGYNEDDVSETKKAASALIGNVGGKTATYISLSFRNMDIADAAQGKSGTSLHSSTGDEALAKASFIYSYDYEANCTGIYIFNYEDYKVGRIDQLSTKKVTLGLELGDNGATPNYAMEEYFDENMPVGELKSGDGNAITYASINYLPYVCEKNNDRYILVNPKVGNITEGCGTYEDPYRISTTKQMLTLYRYLYKEADFETILQVGNWTINEMGGDDAFCDKSNPAHVRQTYQKKESGFPSKEELSQAYYQITGDIDFSLYPEFTGFGTEELPFIGVFVGKENNSQYPLITMSKQNSAELANYGFIQNAKGCVVKDLRIQFTQPVSINAQVTKTDIEGNSITEYEGGIGAGVIATVNGGENIIDNVVVAGDSSANGNANVECFKPMNTKAVIGGYVGIVNRGGVIFRNVDKESLQNFTVYCGVQSTEVTLKDYLYTCSMVGRVKDGYVIYDGSEAGTSEAILTKVSDFNASSSTEGSGTSAAESASAVSPLPLSRSYGVVNRAYLDAVIGTDTIYSKLDWKYDIKNAAQLQIISMALNAGALNYDGSSKEVGYSQYSRQRHGNYDNVGNCTESDQNRTNVITYDNFTIGGTNQYGSFLLQYFQFDSSTSIWSSGTYSDGNGVTALNKENQSFSFLLSGTKYNMSVFETAFRGLGARYFAGGDNVFHCNLKGSDSAKPAEITVHMIVDGIQDVGDAALLNNVTTKSAFITIANITLSGTIENKSEIEGSAITETEQERNAAGFISTLTGNQGIKFENVSLNGLTVQSQKNAGGMIAYDNNGNTNKTVYFLQCGINTTDTGNTTVTGMSDVGGFVGSSNSIVTIRSLKGMNDLTVTSGNVNATEGQRTIGGNAGGLVGKSERILRFNKPEDDYAGETVNCIGNTITVKSAGVPSKIGGLVGWSKNAYIRNLTLTMLHVENVYDGNATLDININDDSYLIGVGGVVGCVTSNGAASMYTVQVGSNDQAESVYIGTKFSYLETGFGGIGGLVGRVGNIGNINLTVSDCHVYGYKNDDNYTTVISGGFSVGGMVGNTRAITGQNLSVENVELKSVRNVGGIMAVHGQSQTATLTNVESKNIHIAFLYYEGFTNKSTIKDRGAAGGICGQSVGDLIVKNATVTGLIVEPEYCNATGGFVGVFGANYNHAGTMQISGENSVSDSKISGGIVGGGIGYIYYDHGEVTTTHKNITISNNILISSQKSISSTTYYGTGSAGGYIGAHGSPSKTILYMDTVTVKDNLIVGYSTNSNGNELYLGGLEGRTKNASDVCNLRLENNYIGMMKGSDTYEENLNKIKSMEVSQIESLKDDLYYVQCSNGTYQYNQTKYGTALTKDNRYQYSYHQGTIFGYCQASSDSRMINVSVKYDDPTYRPVSDVGMISSYNLTSNQAMYGKSRDFAAIVYDGEAQNHPDDIKLPDWLLSNMQTFIGTNHYIFGNLEYIMSDPDRCCYWLEKNYQNSGWIDDTTETADVLSVSNIYKNTYKDGDQYRSQLKIGNQTVPVVVYDSADSGSLDEVIQTYINILTNNSGALNSKVYANKSSFTVSTNKIRVSSEGISIDAGTPSVRYTTSNNGKICTFEPASQGDELNPTTGEGTFTLIHIEYFTNSNKAWSLDIPVYVEKRLKIYSNMRMLPGIQYDTAKVKTTGKYKIDGDDSTFDVVLPIGNSYTVYCEYVYEDILEQMDTLKIPKTFTIDGSNNGTVSSTSFIKGSKLTLIPIDQVNGPGIPYYYEVTKDDQKEINFADFADAFGNKYALADIKGITAVDNYTDVCSQPYEKAVVEQFLLLVDPPEIEKDSNSLYKLQVQPKQLFSDAGYSTLNSRTDYSEHCYVGVDELPAVKYDIVDDNTSVDQESKLASDGKLKVDLQYSVSGSPAYWNSTRSEDLYLDIAFYLKKKNSNSETKLALPAGTVVSYRDEDIAVITGSQGSVYYYQGKNSGKAEADQSYIQINKLEGDKTNDINIAFDFSNADMSAFEADGDSTYYVVAELVVTSDKDMPAAGEVKDSWEAQLTAEAKKDIGFALEVDDLMTLGMNQYSPETTDSGVVSYTASIALPETESTSSLASKYYTIAYQIEEKTSQKDAGTGKPTYTTYTGDDVSLYLGNFTHTEDAKAAASNTDSVNSGKGIVAVSYHFSDSDITNGVDLQDGQTPATDTNVSTKSHVMKTHCTLVANCDGLNMTNYRVKAYLIVSDSRPDISCNGSSLSLISESTNCLKGQLLRTGDWKTITGDVINNDLKNDFFIFTVAKIKTSME